MPIIGSWVLVFQYVVTACSRLVCVPKKKKISPCLNYLKDVAFHINAIHKSISRILNFVLAHAIDLKSISLDY